MFLRLGRRGKPIKKFALVLSTTNHQCRDRFDNFRGANEAKAQSAADVEQQGHFHYAAG